LILSACLAAAHANTLQSIADTLTDGWTLPEGVEGVHPAVWARIVSKMPVPVIDPETGNIRPHCPTDYFWEAYDEIAKQPGVLLKSGCEGETQCDVPSVREQYFATTQKATIDTAVNVICAAEGQCNGVTRDTILGQLKTLNVDFHTANVAFSLADENIRFIVDPTYATIAAYSIIPTWYNQIRTVKKLYANNPAQLLNIFVTGQKSGGMGTLLGIGTFPWDKEALTEYGGLWVNAPYFGPEERTLSHEAGHNVGLWHSFHGVEEVGKCGSACYEEPHALDDSAADLVGDFCADTPAQPTNYQCALPSGEACNGEAWTAYGDEGLLRNIMSYHMDSCMSFFTTQQAARSNCYLCNSIPSLLANSEICE